MRIAVDAMGGDFAPEQIVAGAVRAAAALDTQLVLVGQPQAIAGHLGPAVRNRRFLLRESSVFSDDRIEIEAASEVVSMDESPRKAIRGKPDSSVARAVEMVAEKEADAVVSAGNSGAFMALCVTRLGTVPGVRRPAIAIRLPSPSGYRVLLDAGANVDCRPEHLRDFGLMGSVYAQDALGIENPRVGLLSIGGEPGKGNELTRAAFDLLAEGGAVGQAPSPVLNFIGNVEGGQVFTGGCDVVVCDGFVGNAILKSCEGACSVLLDQLRSSLRSSLLLRLLGPLVRKSFRDLRSRFDYAEYGGALLLGVNGVGVVSHGCSDANAIMNAIAVAYRAVESELIEHLSGAFAERATVA